MQTERRTHQIVPPTAPEMVFLGLILGASFLPPINPPVIYAKVSVNIGIRNINNKTVKDKYPPNLSTLAKDVVRLSMWFKKFINMIRKLGYINVTLVLKALLNAYLDKEIFSFLIFISFKDFFVFISPYIKAMPKKSTINAKSIKRVKVSPTFLS